MVGVKAVADLFPLTVSAEITWLTGMPDTDLMTYNPDDPPNLAPRDALRRLHELAIHRWNYWSSLRPLAPAPPRPNPGPPNAGRPPA